MKIDEQVCIGCGKCIKDCFSRIIHLGPGRAVMEDKPCMECFHCVAVCPLGAVSGTEKEMDQVIPYEKTSFSVVPEHLLHLIQFRRSVRQFGTEQLTEEELGRLIEAARYSPTAGNRQPLRYLVLQEKLEEVTRRAILALGKAAEDENAIQTIFSGHRAYAEYWKRGSLEYQTNGIDGMFYHAPTVLLFVGPPESAVDAGIASSNVELMAASMGLGACYVAFFKRACQADPSLLNDLSIGEGEVPLAILALGRKNVQYYRTVPRKEAKITRL